MTSTLFSSFMPGSRNTPSPVEGPTPALGEPNRTKPRTEAKTSQAPQQNRFADELAASEPPPRRQMKPEPRSPEPQAARRVTAEATPPRREPSRAERSEPVSQSPVRRSETPSVTPSRTESRPSEVSQTPRRDGAPLEKTAVASAPVSPTSRPEGAPAGGEVSPNQVAQAIPMTAAAGQATTGSLPVVAMPVVDGEALPIDAMAGFETAMPILSFLSGHLEALTPKEIPALVMTNTFVANAMNSGDIDAYMAEPQPLGALLTSLGAPATLLDQAQAAGLDVTAMVAPQEFLDVLGFDPARIGAELEMLKANLQTDGFTPYMVRAAALRAQSGVDQTKKGQDRVAPLAKTDSEPIPQKAAERETALDPRVAAALAALSTRVPSLARPDVPVETLSPAEQTRISDLVKSPFQATAQPTGPVAGMPSNLPPELKATLPRPEAPLGQLQSEGRFFAQITEQDPFAALGQSMKAGETLSLDLTKPTMPQLPTAPLLDPTLPNIGAIEALRAALSQEVAPEALTPFAGPRSAETWVLPQQAPLLTMLPNGSVAPLMTTQPDAPTLDFPIDGERANNITPLTMATLGSARETGREGEGRQSDSQGNRESAQDVAPTLINTPDTARTPRASETNFRDAMAGPDELRQTLSQKIFDRASMMLKDGGGSIKIDLGSPELGHLDLAINVNGDKLDVRIVASSDQVRDMIAQDLPRLREALANQNLNLEQVEVGLRGGGAWNQSFAGGGGSEGQRFEEFQEQMRGNTRISTARSVQRMATSAARPSATPRVAGNGQIQVLV